MEDLKVFYVVAHIWHVLCSESVVLGMNEYCRYQEDKLPTIKDRHDLIDVHIGTAIHLLVQNVDCVVLVEMMSKAKWMTIRCKPYQVPGQAIGVNQGGR